MDPMPCACRGSIGIHNQCFDNLRRLRRHQPNCSVCGTDFPPEIRDGLRVERGLVEETSYHYDVTLDENNEYHGTYTSWYHNGNILESIQYSHGELDGRYITYYENGKINEDELYVNGECIHKKLYYTNGNLFEEEACADGKRNGHYKRYYNNGKIAEEAFYVNNICQGIVRTYKINGALHVCSSFKDGVLHGYVYTFDDDMKIISRELFENDLIIECIRY